jgi:predicted permease
LAVSFLSRIFRFESRKSDLEAELRAHLEMAIADRVASGESATEAKAATQLEFGNLPLIEDVTRQTWGWLWLERVLQDVKYGMRQLRRSPGFAASVIGTLALGIAAATAMFTVVDHVLLRPLPFRDPDRLVTIDQVNPKNHTRYYGAWQDIQEWQVQSNLFEQLAVYGGGVGRSFIRGNTDSIAVKELKVSANYFTTFGVIPSLGRDFIQEPFGSSTGKNTGTIILSDAAWEGAFGGDKSIVGKSITLNDTSYIVIGVMPAGIEQQQNRTSPTIYTPLELRKQDKDPENFSNYSVIARLRPGINVRAADTEVATIQKRLSSKYTEANVRDRHSYTEVRSYTDSLVDSDLRKALLALFAASGVLWLIAAVNATNIVMARGAARAREIAMRGALGASRWRVAQQFIVEGLILSSAAALIGAGLAFTAVRLARSVVPQRLNVDLSIQINPTVLAVLCVLTILTAVLSSVWPAFLAVHAPIEPALKQGSQRSGFSRGQRRICSTLVVAEIAMSLTLLVSCGLLLRTIYTLRHVPLGYRTDHIVVANLSIPSYRFHGQNIVVNLYEPLLQRVKHVNGIQGAGLMSQVPLGQSFNITLALYMNGNNITTALKPVTPDIQRIFGFPMVAGRFFNDGDTVTSQPVVVVNRAFASIYSPDKNDPTALIGKELVNLRKQSKAVVIGILNDQHQGAIAKPSEPEVEFSVAQLTPDSGFYQPSTVGMDLVVRTDRPVASIVPDLRAILRQATPELANAKFSTMDQIVEDSFGNQRLAAHLLEFFAASALLLSVAGLYGLLAWIVTQRTREMGVRIALGARRGNMLWLVLRHASLMLLVGIAVGGAMAFSTARLLGVYLFGVSAHDGWTLAAAALLLFLSGILAAWVPAHRASRVDPMQALRAE